LGQEPHRAGVVGRLPFRSLHCK